MITNLYKRKFLSSTYQFAIKEVYQFVLICKNYRDSGVLGPVHSVIKAYTERICLKACQESACISFLNMLLLWKNGSQKRNISNHIRIVHTMNAVPALVCTDCEKKMYRREHFQLPIYHTHGH